MSTINYLTLTLKMLLLSSAFLQHEPEILWVWLCMTWHQDGLSSLHPSLTLYTHKVIIRLRAKWHISLSTHFLGLQRETLTARSPCITRETCKRDFMARHNFHGIIEDDDEYGRKREKERPQVHDFLKRCWSSLSLSLSFSACVFKVMHVRCKVYSFYFPA